MMILKMFHKLMQKFIILLEKFKLMIFWLIKIHHKMLIKQVQVNWEMDSLYHGLPNRLTGLTTKEFLPKYIPIQGK